MRLCATAAMRTLYPETPIELLVATSESVRWIDTIPSGVVATLEHGVPAGLALEVMPIDKSWWSREQIPPFGASLTQW